MVNVRALAVLVLLGLTVALSAAISEAAGAGASPGLRGETRLPLDGRSLWLRDCATCHGPIGQGTPRGLAVDTKGPASFDYEVSTGRMPLVDPPDRVRRHEVRYAPAEVAALVSYASGLGQAAGPRVPIVDPAAGDLPAGGELFRQQCAACHAWAGDGGALLQREAPSLHQATSVQIAEAIRVGPGTMPVFSQAALTDRQVNAVVAYVRSLRRPGDRGGNPLWHLGPLAEGAVVWLIGMGALFLALRWIGESEPR